MRVFVAGAAGVIGRRMVPLLLQAGHHVTGTTRSAERARALSAAGATPAIVDVYDAAALADVMRASRPEIVIHQLTDLPQELENVAASAAANARIRVEGTRNLIAGATAAGAHRLIVQSIAFVYRPGGEPHPETDPLNRDDPARAASVNAVATMEQMTLAAPRMNGLALRYGMLYGPGTWHERPAVKPALHVDAAAQAALLAVTRGAPGLYNIADEDGAVAIDKARRDLGFDPAFRL